MADSPVTRCKNCGASILFAMTEGNRWAPFDAKPEKRFVLAQDSEGRWKATAVAVYASHFATCPAQKQKAEAA